MASDEITNEIILEHLQSMKLDFGKKFDAIDRRFDKMEKRFDKRFDGLDERVGTVEKRLDGIDTALQRRYEKRLELTERVDHIEDKELPRIKQALHLA